MFSSNRQLSELAKAKTCYIDGTFKIVRKPFAQLLSIHSFIKSDSNIKQLPLVFVLMSRRRKKDYKKVLSSILTMLPDQLKVKLFVADFESGLWRALTSVFDDPVIQGCVFQWTQAIWRKTQEIGLQTAYYQKDSVYKFVRKLMALPFLPAEHIPTTFEDIAIKAKSARTKELATYVKNTWLSSTVWLVPSWSIFMRPVRTNNDVEGWHRRINDKAVESNKPFYELLELLHTETTKVPLQVKLIGDGKLKRCQRKKVRAVQGQIFSLWEKYTTQTITTAELLKQTMRLNGPVPSTEDTNQ
ncbi:uncharacterized protein LOC127702292 [Mytilus californianus]|uniref:uncharacterized protein LOC127702292 n=1 Tax=Mytilus californianus TaxID=6549 RepID=UPI0022463672|nr:uncharacterized protein LOC127702292 [Mytilus californianus]